MGEGDDASHEGKFSRVSMKLRCQFKTIVLIDNLIFLSKGDHD